VQIMVCSPTYNLESCPTLMHYLDLALVLESDLCVSLSGRPDLQPTLLNLVFHNVPTMSCANKPLL
jgi:hypothetical protein